MSGLWLQHEPVAVDGLAVRRPAGELGRVDRGDSAGEDGAVRADELDAVARPEVALPAADADGEQARAALDDRLAGAGVDRDLPRDPLPVPNSRMKFALPTLTRRPATTPSAPLPVEESKSNT